MRWTLILFAALIGCDSESGSSEPDDDDTGEPVDCETVEDDCFEAMKSCCLDMDEWNEVDESCDFIVSADDCDLDLQQELCDCLLDDGYIGQFCDTCD